MKRCRGVTCSENVLRAFHTKACLRAKRGKQMISRREFIAATGAAAAVTSVAGAAPKIPGPRPPAQPKKSSRLFLPDDDLKPSTNDRLPLEWHKQRAKLLQENSPKILATAFC